MAYFVPNTIGLALTGFDDGEGDWSSREFVPTRVLLIAYELAAVLQPLF